MKIGWKMAKESMGQLYVIRRQGPYTRPNQGDVPAAARRAESPPTDITDSDTDGSDVEESTVPLHKILKPAFGKIAKEVPKLKMSRTLDRAPSLLKVG
jgi:hypothetical protein